MVEIFLHHQRNIQLRREGGEGNDYMDYAGVETGTTKHEGSRVNLEILRQWASS